MDVLDRLAGHDAWTTRRLLRACQHLTPEQLDRPLDIGPGSLRATFVHTIGCMERWADRIDERPLRDLDKDGNAGVDELLARVDAAAVDLHDVARSVADTNRLDEPMEMTYNETLYRFTRGTALVHVFTHGMHHRAQIINMLRQLGVKHDVEGDAIDWELAHAPVPQAAE